MQSTKEENVVSVVQYTIFHNGTSRMDKIPKPEELSFCEKKWKNLDAFKELFPQNKIPILELNEGGENILQYCARMKEVGAVNYLLGALNGLQKAEKAFVETVFINQQSTSGRRDTVLTNIALYCSESLDGFLEHFKPDPSITNQGGDITLSLIDDFPIYKRIFEYTKEQKPDSLPAFNTRGRTPLMLACYSKDVRHVKHLLSDDTISKTILSGSYSGYNAFHYAGFNGSVEIFECLKKHHKGTTQAKQEEFCDIVKQLSHFHRTMLHESAQHGFHGNHDMVKFLLENYGTTEITNTENPIDLFDPRTRDERGYNLLHYACVKSDRHSLLEEQTDKLPLIQYLHETIGLNINEPAIGIQSYGWLFEHNKNIEVNQKVSNLTREVDRLRQCEQDPRRSFDNKQLTLEHIQKLITKKEEELNVLKQQKKIPQHTGNTYPKFDIIKQWIGCITQEFKTQFTNYDLDTQNDKSHQSKINKLKDKIAEWYAQGVIVHTPLSIAIMFGNKEGVEYALAHGALFDITALIALEKLAKPKEKNYDRYEDVNNLITDDIKKNSSQILKNTNEIFSNINLEKYFATMTQSISPNKNLDSPNIMPLTVDEGEKKNPTCVR